MTSFSSSESFFSISANLIHVRPCERRQSISEMHSAANDALPSPSDFALSRRLPLVRWLKRHDQSVWPFERCSYLFADRNRYKRVEWNPRNSVDPTTNSLISKNWAIKVREYVLPFKRKQRIRSSVMMKLVTSASRSSSTGNENTDDDWSSRVFNVNLITMKTGFHSVSCKTRVSVGLTWSKRVDLPFPVLYWYFQ